MSAVREKISFLLEFEAELAQIAAVNANILDDYKQQRYGDIAAEMIIDDFASRIVKLCDFYQHKFQNHVLNHDYYAMEKVPQELNNACIALKSMLLLKINYDDFSDSDSTMFGSALSDSD